MVLMIGLRLWKTSWMMLWMVCDCWFPRSRKEVLGELVTRKLMKVVWRVLVIAMGVSSLRYAR